MSSVPRFVGELHVPGSSARTRHRGAFTISTRCRDTRERAGSSSPWPPVGAETSHSQRPHVARPAKNPDRSMWRALMSSSFRFVCVGPRSTPARGLPHNSSSSHSQSPLGVGTFCGQRHDAGSRAALASPPLRAGRCFPWKFSLSPSSVRWSHESEPSTVSSAYRETWPQGLTWMTGWAHAETSQAQARGIALDAPRYPGAPGAPRETR